MTEADTAAAKTADQTEKMRAVGTTRQKECIHECSWITQYYIDKGAIPSMTKADGSFTMGSTGMLADPTADKEAARTQAIMKIKANSNVPKIESQVHCLIIVTKVVDTVLVTANGQLH